MIALHNVRPIGQGPGSITLHRGTIASIGAIEGAHRDSQSIHLHFDDCLAFPGLINSHDHLHFNLFPRLGNRIYADYVEWGHDIHAVNRTEIAAILQIPKPLRTQWGLYKNLLCGVTTVVHHGEYLPIPHPVIDVYQRCNMLHSVQLEKRWKWKLNKPFAARRPYVIHIGEGTNRRARQEIDTLTRWNLLRRKLIGVHGVAMRERQAGAFAALVWCPDSNFFLLNRTAEIARLRRRTTILFGTDSTLSARWNLWEQLRLASTLQMMDDEDLFYSMTCAPAMVWQLRGRGRLAAGYRADIVVANRKTANGEYRAWCSIDPEDIVLVVQHGTIRLADEVRYQQLARQGYDCSGLHKIILANTTKYVYGDLPGLIAEIKRHAPEVEFPVARP